MRAPPEEREDLYFGSDPDDSDEDITTDTKRPPGAFPDRSEAASSVYY